MTQPNDTSQTISLAIKVLKDMMITIFQAHVRLPGKS